MIVSRPGLPDPTPEMLLAAGLDPLQVDLCAARTPAVGATEIRDRLAAGESLVGRVDPAIAAYIEEHGLYGPGERA